MSAVQTETAPGDRVTLLEQREVHLSEYWAVIVKRRKLIAVAIGMGVASAVVVSLLSKPLYRAVVTINVERERVTPLDIGQSAPSIWDAFSYNPEFLPTQVRLMKSRVISERVAERLRLGEDPKFAEGAPGGTKKAPDDNVVGRVGTQLRGRVDAAPIRGTNIVELSYIADSPKTAADIANALAESYIDWNQESKFRAIGQATQFLQAQIEQLKAEVDDKEQKLQTYGRSKDIVSVDPQQNITMQRLESLNRDLTATVTERVTKEARYYELQNSRPESIAETLSGGVISPLRSEQLKLEREYAEKLNLYKPEWPAMQQLRAQIQKGKQHLDTIIQETVNQAREQAKSEWQAALRKEENLKEVLRTGKVEAMNLSVNAVEYNNLKLEVTTKRALLDQLLKRESETAVMARLRGGRESSIRIVDRALPPGGRFSPSYRNNGMFGLFLGLAGGVGLAFFLEYLDRSLRTTEQVEKALRLPALGVIPAVGEAAGGYGYGYGYGYGRRRKKKPQPQTDGEKVSIELLPHNKVRSVVAEAYRAFRASLLLSRAGGIKSVIITSGFPGEGKTSTVANLAIVMGQLGKNVLVIDADLHKPRLHQVFRMSNRVGLVSILAEDLEPSRAIQKTELPGVSIVTSGPNSPNPSGLLASDRMRKTLALLCENFDFVILDSPPVAPVADAMILGHLTDGVVLCVKGGFTAREHVLRARDRLLTANVRILGVLLNNLPEPGPGYGGGRYYYAAYSKGYVDEPAGEVQAPPPRRSASG